MSEIQGKPVYGICDCKEKKQVLSVEQTVELIQQMASNGWQVPADYIPKTSVNGVIEQNNKDELIFWRGTKAKYEALTAEEKEKYTPFITDDPTLNEIGISIRENKASIENINQRLIQLGFREGSVELASGINATQNYIKRQGNVVQGYVDFRVENTEGYSPAVFGLDISTTPGYSKTVTIGTIPEEFRPATTDKCLFTDRVFQVNADVNVVSGSGSWVVASCSASVNSDNTLTLRLNNIYKNDGTYTKDFTVTATVYSVTFSYEADPLPEDRKVDA